MTNQRNKRASDFNYQDRAKEFAVGQSVRYLFGGTEEGRVLAVYPAIGMVEIQWPSTSARHPVEDLQIINPGEASFVAPQHAQVPGGIGSKSVSNGSRIDRRRVPAVPLVEPVKIDPRTIDKVARVWVKQALYWNGVNRQYRCTRAEADSGHYVCPKCCQDILKKAIYKREDGVSVRLLACRGCLFLIRENDIIVADRDCEG